MCSFSFIQNLRSSGSDIITRPSLRSQEVSPSYDTLRITSTLPQNPTVFLLWACITHTLVLLYNIFSHLSIDFDNFLSQLTFYHLQKLGFLMFQGSKNASWWRYGKKVRRMLPRRPAGAGSQAAFPCHSEAFLLRTARISTIEHIVRAESEFLQMIENECADREEKT